MTDIKQLIERLRKEGEWVLPGLWKPNQLCKEAADALERRTQPVGVEPVGFVWFHQGLPNFDDTEVLRSSDDKRGTPIPLYSAETVARLQAELERVKEHSANRLIGLCRCGEEREALQASNAQLQAERDEFADCLKDARYALYGNGPGNPKIDAALAKIEGSKSKS